MSDSITPPTSLVVKVQKECRRISRDNHTKVYLRSKDSAGQLIVYIPDWSLVNEIDALKQILERLEIEKVS